MGVEFEKRCPNCGSGINKEWKFCPECDFDLSSKEKPIQRAKAIKIQNELKEKLVEDEIIIEKVSHRSKIFIVLITILILGSFLVFFKGYLIDSDGDGYVDNSDAFPNNKLDWLDSDNDDIGDNTDAFPNDSTETVDSDGDGFGNNKDAFPQNRLEWKDSDRDGVGDNTDAFPLDPTETIDSDKDGVGDNKDAFPHDSKEWKDSDGDGRGDNSDAYPLDSLRWSGDTDNDGLNDEEELQKGTNINNPDTDGDTVPDGYDTHPLGGGAEISKTFSWQYAGKSYSFSMGFSSDVFSYYSNKQRLVGYTVSTLREYIMYTHPEIIKVANKLKSMAEENGIKQYEAYFAIAFVQYLPYTSDEYTGRDEYPKYAIETLIPGSGDCEDTSILSAALVKAMNYDTVLLGLPSHMALGIWCNGCTGTYYEVDGKRFYYIETTNSGWSVGQIPAIYKNVSATIYRI